MIDPTWTLDNFPVSVVITRASDGHILYTNARFQAIFGGVREDFLELPTSDLISPNDAVPYDEGALRAAARPEGETYDFFKVFRRLDGEEFIGWVRNVHHQSVEHGSLNIAAVFEYYDVDDDARDFASFVSMRNDVIRGKVSAHFAHELNMRLGSISAILDAQDSPEAALTAVRREFDDLRNFGERLFRVGMQSSEAAKFLSDNDNAARGNATPVSELSVLVVDDEPNFANLLATLVRTKAKDVTVAHSGDETAARLAESVFDVAIVDLNLGEEDGRAVAERIGATSPSTRIVYMTGFAHAASILEAMKSNVVLRKPFTIADVERALAKEFAR